MSSEPLIAALDSSEIINPTVCAESLTEVVNRLAGLPLLEYDRNREEEASRLGVRVTALDKEVEKTRKNQQAATGSPKMFPEVVPWQYPVNGAEMLDELVETIKRFIVCDEDTAIATALWCTFTWVVDYVQVAPLAIITAPEKRCGKSQLLALIGKLSRRPLVASNISPSATFRVIEAYYPTLLIDEADTFLKDSEELRGVINSGHTRQSAYVIRNVGDNHEPTSFSTWGAKALSGIGTLPDTLTDRAIILTLRRKLPGEEVERLRHADKGLFENLASKLARFAQDKGVDIGLARPTLPDALNDRAQDNWEPLLAIADCASGKWPSVARVTALAVSGTEHDSASLSTELLADIHEIFNNKGVGRISSADLIKALCDDDEKSWATYNRGKPISPRQLTKRLKEYGIQSKTVRIGHDTPRGFDVAQFQDAFNRYLDHSATATQTSADNESNVSDVNPFLQQNATFDARCTTETESETSKVASTKDCGNVADGSGNVEVEL